MENLQPCLTGLYGAVNKRNLSTGETARCAKTCRMWRIRATVADSAAVKMMGVGIWGADGLAPRVGFELPLTATDFSAEERLPAS